MAKQLKLAAQTRATAGRSAVRHIKKQGLVPAVIYGAKEPTQNLQIAARDIRELLSHATGEHFLVELAISDGAQTTNRLALVKEIQHHPVRRDVLHIDFHSVKADQKLHAAVPVETFGEANGVKNFGGSLEMAMHELDVECLPKDLPEFIRIDVSALELNESIHVRDITLPAGVTAHADPDLVVVRVAAPRVEVEPVPAAEAAAAQPEVIKEKKEDAAPEKPEKK